MKKITFNILNLINLKILNQVSTTYDNLIKRNNFFSLYISVSILMIGIMLLLFALIYRKRVKG